MILPQIKELVRLRRSEENLEVSKWIPSYWVARRKKETELQFTLMNWTIFAVENN